PRWRSRGASASSATPPPSRFASRLLPTPLEPRARRHDREAEQRREHTGAVEGQARRVRFVAPVEDDAERARGDAERGVDDLVPERVDEPRVLVDAAEAHLELAALRLLHELPHLGR